MMLAACSKQMAPDEIVPFLPDPRREELVFEGMEVLPSPAGTTTEVNAGLDVSPSTRSRLDGPRVLWTKGDGFRAHFINMEGEYNYADFTTQDDGTTYARFTTENQLEGTGFVCLYPGYERMNTDSYGVRVFDVVLPIEQTAVPGGLAEGVNRAIAYTESFEPGTNLRFDNLPALMKFRLEGGIAGSIRSVSLTGTYLLSGSRVICWRNGGLDYYPGRFKDEVLSPTVTLTGEFVPGQDYYIALWPGTTTGFEMTFSDGEGNFSTLRSSKTVTFTRSVIKDVGAIELGDAFTGAGSIPTEPVLYMSATQGTKPVTLVVVPEGFRTEELPQFERLAKMGLDYMFNIEPYRSYKDYFNTYILKVASNESGAGITDGNGNVTTARDTYFGAAWGESTYSDMAANSTKLYNFVSTHCPDILDKTHTIKEVVIALLVNDVRYGGRSHAAANGQAYCIIPFSLAGGYLRWDIPSIMPVSEETYTAGYRNTTEEERVEMGVMVGDWRNIMTHELGHSFARLMDEYWSSNKKATASEINSAHAYTVPYGMNISTSYSNPPWKILLEHKDELTALDPAYERIGVFQGGYNAMYNCWRSERVSAMIDNRPYFSAWQRYLIAKRVMTLAEDADQFTWESWLSKDVPNDPLRDGARTRSAVDYDWVRANIPVYPMPAPPALTED